jgi:hypothetical protein
MPNFSAEGPRVEQSYLDLLSQINISAPEVELTAKWHPSDVSDHKIFNFLRLKVIEDQPLGSTNDFEMIISCVSALVVNLRRQFERVAIFHPGYYGTLGKPYISQNHFFISKDISKIVECVKNSNFNLDNSYIEIFAMDDKCRDLLSSFLSLDHKRMV